MLALEWLKRWENLINATDYGNARQLFSPDVIGFGTVAGTTQGIEQLETMQWRNVWPTIRNFVFDAPLIGHAHHENPGLVVIAATWHSDGRSGEGGWYARRGRATAILENNGNALLCIHTHFSMEPGIPALF